MRKYLCSFVDIYGYLEVSKNGGYTPESSKIRHLSIESHGDLGTPHFKKPSFIIHAYLVGGFNPPDKY